MKTCPVCNAVAFDDASICYGCMHRFADGETAEPAGVSGAPSVQPPEFFVRFTPTADSSGAVTWSCAVETAPC